MTDILNELLDAGEKHARKILLERREKQLTGFYHLVGPEKSLIMPSTFTNDIEKQLFILEVKRVSREIGAVAAMVINEAWMLKIDHSGQPNTSWHRDRLLANLPRPSQSPDRVEVVHIAAMDATDCRARCLQILRDKPGGRIISLIEDKILSGTDGYAGQMVEGIVAKPDDLA